MLISRRMMACAAGVAAVTLAIAGLTVHGRRSTLSPGGAFTTSSPASVALAAVAAQESDIRDRDIEFYTARAGRDRRSTLDRVALAGLLITRARDGGSQADLERAESLAREALAISEHRNGRAFELLATVLMARHAFRDAHEIALRADSLEPQTPSHLALLGEVELELGLYDAAAAHFQAVKYDGKQFTIGARLARWYEVTGNAAIARALLTRAAAAADRRDDLPREQVAWFHYRLGELERRTGRLNAAQAAFERALARHDGDIRALGGLARVAVARGNWRDAIAFGERATGAQLDPTTLGDVSQAYAALGDSAQSARFAVAMSVSALTQPGSIHRAWGLHLLDHGTPAERAEVLRRAQSEIGERRDVYGHDLLAWALHRAGRHAEAQLEMQRALSQRTEDVQLAAHARAIHGALAAR